MNLKSEHDYSTVTEREDPLFWEHGGNRAVRDGKLKLVQRHNNNWELYNLHIDRTE